MQLMRQERSGSDGSTLWSGDRTGDRNADYRRRAKRRAREGARRQRDVAKEELGRWAFDTLESYFPEQAKARRRQNSAMTFAVGVAVGILVRHLLDR